VIRLRLHSRLSLHKRGRGRQILTMPTGNLKHVQDCAAAHGTAFRKYNSTIGFIGFPPSQAVIIDKSDNLDALRI
jgi:hypothetical protein